MRQLSTELDDRELRFDGVSIVPVEELAEALLRGVPPRMLRVRTADDEVVAFNSLVAEEDQIQLLQPEPIQLSYGWKLPEKYATLDVQQYLTERFDAVLPTLVKRYSKLQILAAAERLAAEIDEIQRRGMVDFFRTIIYVLDEFRDKNVVWGVGRGSSCACYALFILGLHSVDCIKYNVPMSEFFHD